MIDKDTVKKFIVDADSTASIVDLEEWERTSPEEFAMFMVFVAKVWNHGYQTCYNDPNSDV